MTDRQKPRGDDVSSVRQALTERARSAEPHAHVAWRTWLAALGTSADAAKAAALAYESLDSEGREAWLRALDEDASDVAVPKVALYMPLLRNEKDEQRRARITRNLPGGSRKRTRPRAVVSSRGEDRVCLIVTPLYLDFVEILFCRYAPDVGVHEAWHQGVAHENDVATCATEIGITMIEASLPRVVEEIAHAIVADRRRGRPAPPSLLHYVDLFAPDVATRGASGQVDG